MLVRRVVTRPATTIRQAYRLQRRFILPSRPQLQAPRPNLRFQADGKPPLAPETYNFLKNCAVFLSIWITIDLLYDMVGLGYKKENLNNSLLLKISFFQQMDITYDSVNFDDPISTISYFTKLYRPFSTYSEEEANKDFKYFMMKVTNKKTKNGSPKFAEVKMHDIMRSAAEKVHGVLREFNQDSTRIAITYELVILALAEAMQSLTDLMLDCDDDESEFYPKLPYWKILSS